MKKTNTLGRLAVFYLAASTPAAVYAGISSTPLPEPNTIALFAAGALVFALVNKWRKK